MTLTIEVFFLKFVSIIEIKKLQKVEESSHNSLVFGFKIEN